MSCGWVTTMFGRPLRRSGERGWRETFRKQKLPLLGRQNLNNFGKAQTTLPALLFPPASIEASWTLLHAREYWYSCGSEDTTYAPVESLRLSHVCPILCGSSTLREGELKVILIPFRP